MKITSLKDISYEILFAAFNEAFVDYEMQLSSDELLKMLNRRGFVPELSYGAFEGEKLVAFTFNGIGKYNEIKTAYDTGTGTVKDYRGKGLATAIFTHSIPFLKEAGVTQYLLEVLQHNTKAVSVYKNLGFKVNREFNYFVSKENEIIRDRKESNTISQIRQIDLSFSNSMIEFWDFKPSWQNSFEAISRKIEDFIIIGAFINQQLTGYCIFEPQSGDITQIAVKKEYRRNGIATALLNQALSSITHDSVKVINTDIECESITAFLQSKSIQLKGMQFEMIKQL